MIHTPDPDEIKTRLERHRRALTGWCETLKALEYAKEAVPEGLADGDVTRALDAVKFNIGMFSAALADTHDELMGVAEAMGE